MKWFWLSSLFVFLLDRLSKFLVAKELAEGALIKILPFFNLVKVWNYGIAFGIFNHGPEKGKSLLLIIGTGLLLFACLILALKSSKKPGEKLFTIGLGLILGGGIGNLYDRIVYGRVLDFLDFHLGRYHWPAFNVADAGVTVGMFLVLIHLVRTERCS